MELININKLKHHEKNPRRATDTGLDKTIISLLTLPEMHELEPMLYDDETLAVISGNLRLKAFRKISKKTLIEITEMILAYKKKHNKTDIDEKRIEYLADYWENFLNTKQVPVVRVSNLTAEQKEELMLKCNAHYGEWDTDILASMDYELTELDDFGINPIVYNAVNDLDLELQDSALREASNNDFFSLTFTLPKDLKQLFDAFDKSELQNVLIDYVNQ